MGLGDIFYLYALQRCSRLRKIYSDPIRLQEDNLKNILHKAKDTAFGKRFGFKAIRSIPDYQRRVPLVRYEDMKPWIDGCLQGKANHIWPGRIKFFALTSGTTSGRSKYIPISQDMIKENRKGGIDCISFYLFNTEDKRLFDGKSLFLGGSTSLESLKGGFFAGDMSGIMSRFIPFYISGRYEPGRRIAFIPDWEEKIKKAVERTKDKDIRLIAGIPSWLLVLFDQLLTAKKREKICEVWPGISLLIYGGLNFSPYQKLMEDIIGKDIYYMETYFASEALMGIQDTPYPPGQTDGNGLLLMLDYGVFYEFVKAEDITKANPRRYTAADIEEDVSYAIIITNTSGLYSYIIGDTVRFVSKRPLRVRVTGRLEDFLSTLGEHLIAEEVEYTMSQASLRTGALVKNFTVAPYFPKEKTHRPGHQWLVEFSKPPDSTDKFMKTIDEALCLKNDDYKAHRKGSFGMSMPILYELKEGTFYQWHKLKGTLGGQHKTPRLKNDRVMAEELIELSED